MDENKEYLVKYWKDGAQKVLDAIESETIIPMTNKEFLSHCTACGGNWGGMLLTGIRELYPAVYDAIPDNMGFNAWGCLCTVLSLLSVAD